MKKCIFFIGISILFICVFYSKSYCEDSNKNKESYKNENINISKGIRKKRNSENSKSYKLFDDNSITEELDYKDIQEVIDESNLKNFSFKDEVNKVVKNGNIDYREWVDKVKNIVLIQFDLKKDMIVRILILVIISAIFTNFTYAIGNAYVAQTGFLVVYMILITVVINLFSQMYEVGNNAIILVKRFIEVLLPTYTVASIMGTGINTGAAFSQITMIIIVVIEQIFLRIILPLINIYIILILMNNINESNGLHRLADFIQTVIKWGNRGTLGIVTSIVTIQKLIAPTSDMTAIKLIGGGMRYIPYLCNSMEVAKDTVISAGYLIKNAMGAVSIIVIMLICLLPAINMLGNIIVYEMLTVFSEPIADKRIVGVMKGVSNGGKLLIESLFTSASLLIITIALLAS